MVAEVRYDDNQLSQVVLHPVELGYGDTLTTSGVPRLVTDEAVAREIVGQVVDQTARFGLPALDLRYSGVRGTIIAGR